MVGAVGLSLRFWIRLPLFVFFKKGGFFFPFFFLSFFSRRCKCCKGGICTLL